MNREIWFALIATVPSVAPDGVLVALAEALHLDQPAPRERRRDLEVARRVCRGGRGRGGAGRIVHVDVDELRAERAAEGRRQVARPSAGRSRRSRRRRPGTPGCRRRPAGSCPRSDRRSCRARCRRCSDRCTSRSSVPGTKSKTTERCTCAVPPLALTATTLRTVVPPVTGDGDAEGACPRRRWSSRSSWPSSRPCSWR